MNREKLVSVAVALSGIGGGVCLGGLIPDVAGLVGWSFIVSSWLVFLFPARAEKAPIGDQGDEHQLRNPV
jgi:hypothetical protein